MTLNVLDTFESSVMYWTPSIAATLLGLGYQNLLMPSIEYMEVSLYLSPSHNGRSISCLLFTMLGQSQGITITGGNFYDTTNNYVRNSGKCYAFDEGCFQ